MQRLTSVVLSAVVVLAGMLMALSPVSSFPMTSVTATPAFMAAARDAAWLRPASTGWPTKV